MKKGLLFFFLMCAGACLPALAQQDDARALQYHEMRYQPQLHFSVGVGANTDMSEPSPNPASLLFGVRPETVPAFDLRMMHLFAPCFGWYADVRFKLFKSRNVYETLGSQLGEALLNKLLPGIDHLHLAYSIGGVFRIEGDRWQCYPRLGIGQSYYGTNRKAESIKEGEKELLLNCDGAAICLNFGVSTQYRLTPRMALLFDIFWQQPLSTAKSYLYEKEGEAEAQEYVYRSSTIGRELNVSLGVNFCFGPARR